MREFEGFNARKLNRQRRQEAQRNRQVAPEGPKLLNREPKRNDLERKVNLLAKSARKGRLRFGSLKEMLNPNRK